MSEGGKGKGVLKAVLGAVAGLLSGAALVCLTPVIDRLIKPPTPLANFEARPDGLAVTFHNLTTGVANLSGWWDFGDGSSLVPVVADQDVTHTYTKPGSYSAKLSVHNLANETNERTVALQLEAAGAVEAPRILSLDAVPLNGNVQAPATFRVTSDMKNVQQAVWDLDEGRPLEIGQSSPAHQERLVAFSRPGNYAIKLAAFNGLQHEEKVVNISVKPAPAGALTATLYVTDQATFVEHNERHAYFGASFPPGVSGNVYHFDLVVHPTPGWAVADVQIVSAREAGPWMQGRATMPIDPATFKPGPVRNLQITRAADGKSVHLSGDLLRNSAKEWPSMNLPIVLREEKRKPVTRLALPVMAPLTLPGMASLELPALPAGWQDAKRQIRIQLQDSGNRTVWQDTHLPVTAGLPMGGRRYSLSVTQTGNHVQLNLTQ